MSKAFKSSLKLLLREYKALTHHLLHVLKYPLNSFHLNWYSQNGEDGVLAELLRRLEIRKGWVVEFGAWDGIWCSNTYHLIKTHPGFKAVYIEGDKPRFQDLLETASKHKPRIIPINAFVDASGPNSLDALLGKTEIPSDFEVLSIDVDSTDYQIWEGLSQYQPKLVIIEVNSSVPLGIEQIHGNGTQGTSFTSMRSLGEKKGYACVWHRGNCIFVRNDLVEKILGTIPSRADQDALFTFKK